MTEHGYGALILAHRKKEFVLELLEISKINLDNQYLRLDSDIDSLCKSIETIGLIHPITVDKNYRLLAGGRRYSAMKKLGFSEVPVEVVDRNELEQELISIDENLVRKPLDKLELEQSLNRGREIYEKLNPTAEKVNVENKVLTPAEKREQKERMDQDTTSFVAVTAEKTGLSKSSIQSAIKRDELSSEAVKRAREQGKINASQTNEIIRLDKEKQEQVLKLVEGRPAKDIKKIVEAVKQGGLEGGLEQAEQLQPMPREYKELKAAIGKMNKSLSKILLEDIEYFGPEKNLIWRELRKLQDRVESFFEAHDDENSSEDESETMSSFQ